MYRRPKFLEVLLDIRVEMARAADYDVDLFAELVRSGRIADGGKSHEMAAEPAAKAGSQRRGAGKPRR